MADSRGITADIFDVLRVRPAIGRAFAAEEDQVPDRDRVAVISHAFWAARFNQDATTGGRTVRLNGFTRRLTAGRQSEECAYREQMIRS